MRKAAFCLSPSQPRLPGRQILLLTPIIIPQMCLAKRRLVRFSERMGTQANDGGGYGLVSAMPTLSSRGNVLVYAAGLESEAGKRKAMTCPQAIHYDKSSTHLCELENMLLIHTSLKQCCQHMFLPCFSASAPAPASWAPARGTHRSWVLFSFS